MGCSVPGRAEPVEIDPERLRKAIRYLKGHPEQNDPRTWCTVPLDRNVGGQQLHRRGRHPQALMCINTEAPQICISAIAFEGTMIMAPLHRLPSRFPVGTHYIVEGEPRKGTQPRIVSRYVVMPSGIRYDLMTPAGWVRKPADLARKRRQPC
jgi:hypothetical protein